MFKMEDENYVPLQCCSFTNPITSGGKSDLDNVTLPCESEECGCDCNSCVIQKIMNDMQN